MMTTTDQEKMVHSKIDELQGELIKVALGLGNVDNGAQAGEVPRNAATDIRQHERLAAEYVYSWLSGNGFDTKRQGAPDRFNVLGAQKGTGGDSLVGLGIGNCKGPMACWMIAAKAIKDAGVSLPGDILLSAVVGETGGAPVDEFESPQWDSHELGARYVASHGGMAEYVVIAEATAFTIVPVMTGFVYFKVTIYGGSATHTPFQTRPEESMETSVNPILRMCKFAERFERYADDYSETNTYEFQGGTIRPNAHIAAIRGGLPPWPPISPEFCSVYCDFRLAPGANPLDIQRDLENILEGMGSRGKVEMFKYLPGYEARQNKGFDTLKEAVVNAHTKMFNEPPQNPPTAFVSMWRDLNPYNEIGVPAISYGFPTGYTHDGATNIFAVESRRVKIADMITAAKLYASVALDLCGRSTADGP